MHLFILIVLVELLVEGSPSRYSPHLGEPTAAMAGLQPSTRVVGLRCLLDGDWLSDAALACERPQSYVHMLGVKGLNRHSFGCI
jgi:hypothetical protein